MILWMGTYSNYNYQDHWKKSDPIFSIKLNSYMNREKFFLGENICNKNITKNYSENASDPLKRIR